MNSALLRDLAITAELCGSDLSEAASRIVLSELEHYDEDAVHGALARCRRELHGRFTLAAIIERLDDGRPGPEEAWGMMPKDEAESALITNEMREAMGAALRLLGDGDHVAARVAFLESYRRKVGEARAARLPVTWSPSLGHDPSGRTGVLIEGVRLGRITAQQALTCAGAGAAEVERALTALPHRVGLVKRLTSGIVRELPE